MALHSASLYLDFLNLVFKVDDDYSNEDVDVAQERERVRNLDDREQALAVRGVYKYYGDLCAVRNLTIGVNPTDCFGLLGKNFLGLCVKILV